MILCKLFHASFVQWSRLVSTLVESTLSTLYVASGAFALISIVEMFFRFWHFSKTFLIITIGFVSSDAFITRYIFMGNRNYARCCDPGSRSWLISYTHEYCPAMDTGTAHGGSHPNTNILFLAATKQLYKWYFPSVCLSVRLSVRLSHLFHHVPIMVSSWNFQELLPWSKEMSMQKVKVRGQRARSQRSTPNLAVSGL